jgi:hypothetical protein
MLIDMAETTSAWQYFITGFICYFIWWVGKTLYRLTLHPLAKFPGPKLAGATYLYEFYFDGINVGSYTIEIARMHEIYGEIGKLP